MAGQGGISDGAPRLGVVINPSKPVNLDRLRAAVDKKCAAAGWGEALWWQTTEADPGTGQAREAAAAGVAAVLVGGGDGTVRAAAAGLAETGVPMSVLPLGTGNLFARNLDLPLSGTSGAIEAAIRGRDRAVDIGWLQILRGSGASAGDGEHPFLVMSGIGFDGALMAGTNERLKKRVGWLAYFISGVRESRGQRVRAYVEIDGRRVSRRRLRSVLVGNCGRIMGGLTLLPDAEIDDGWLDIAMLDPRGGVLGWTTLFGEVVQQGAPRRMRLRLPKPRMISHFQARTVTVATTVEQHVQADGDVVGTGRGLRARVDHGALIVRLPA